MTSIRVISFDLDDTLWALGPVLEAAEERAYRWLCDRVPALPQRFDRQGLRDLRLKLLHTQPDLRHQISEIRRVSVEQALLDLNVSATQAAELADAALEEFLHARHAVEFFDGALEVLAQLAQQFTLGSLTNGNANPKRLGLDQYFSFSFSAEQLNASKPAPDLFQAALDATGASVQELVHVGDHVAHDVDAAKRFGAKAVWLNPAALPWPSELLPPDQTIKDVRELPDAIAAIG